MEALITLTLFSLFGAIMATPLPVRFRVGRHADPAFKGRW